jgi:hypothetical protein
MKNDRLGSLYKMNISQTISEHFLREPIKSPAQKVFIKKNLDFKN